MHVVSRGYDNGQPRVRQYSAERGTATGALRELIAGKLLITLTAKVTFGLDGKFTYKR